MACSTEGAVIPRYAVATVGLMMANGAGAFGLFLLSRGAPCSTSREALRRLHEQIHLQTVQRVGSTLDREQFDSPDAYAAHVRERAARAVSLVLPALASCRANRINDFRRWLDRRIDDAIAGDPLAAPPAAISVPTRSESTLPLPTSPRDSEARLSAVLRALPRDERRVLELRASAGGRSWMHVAERVGLSAHAARRLHARALAHARELALELLSGRSLTLPPADASDQAA